MEGVHAAPRLEAEALRHVGAGARATDVQEGQDADAHGGDGRVEGGGGAAELLAGN